MIEPTECIILGNLQLEPLLGRVIQGTCLTRTQKLLQFRPTKLYGISQEGVKLDFAPTDSIATLTISA